MSKRYELVEKPNSEFFFVRILLGEFVGVMIRYDTISFEENEEKDELTLHFDYDIVEKPNEFTDQDLKKSGKFVQELGEIILDILNHSFETGDYKLGRPKHDGKPSDDDPPETAAR